MIDKHLEQQLREAGVGEPAIRLYDRRGPAVGSRIDPARCTPVQLAALLANENAAPPPYTPTITLPWSCLVSDNQRHTRIGAHGKAYVAARDRARSKARELWGDAPPLDGPVRVDVVFTPPNAGGPDPANMLKALLDALQTVAYANDRQVRAGSWTSVAPNIDAPNALITVTCMEP